MQTIPIPYPPPITFNILSTQKSMSFEDLANLYGKIQIKRQGEILLEILRDIEPRLIRP